MSKPLRKSVLSGGIVSLNVGTPETPFDVHVERLCDCSPYFERKFQDRFVDAQLEPVSLPDDDSDSFTEFLNWVYTGTIFQNEVLPTLTELFRLWILAEKFEVLELQNLVVDLCNGRVDSKPHGVLSIGVIDYVYGNTSYGSLLRRICVESFVKMGGKQGIKARFSKIKAKLPRAFLEDLCEFWFEQKEFGDTGINVTPDCTAVPDDHFVHRRDNDQSEARFPRNIHKRDTDFDDPPRQASKTRLEMRPIKIPKPRKSSNGPSLSTDNGTPSTTSGDTDKEVEILKAMKDLEA